MKGGREQARVARARAQMSRQTRGVSYLLEHACCKLLESGSTVLDAVDSTLMNRYRQLDSWVMSPYETDS
jgi:hypothetical protein